MVVIPLGTSSGVPTRTRNVSAVAINIGPCWCLFDCGEGTQYRLLELSWKRKLLDSIFITHLHADHLLGLPGLLGAMSLRDQRVEKLSIYGPPGIRDFVECTLKFVSVKLGYELQVTEIEPGAIYLNSVYQVRALPLDHRIPAYGYRLDSEGVGVAYCTDTRPTRNSVELGRDADLLIHEATYAQDLADKSWERGHSTAHEAAEIARQAGARRLLLTHFSPRYQDLRKLRDEARKVFPKTDVAKDLHHWKIERKLERTQTQPQPNMQKEAS